MSNIGVIITGGDSQALGALRTLARKSIPTIITDWEICIGRFSKYKTKFFKSPKPQNQKEYIDFLINLAEKEHVRGWMLLANSDDVVYLLSKYKNQLSKFYLIPTPRLEVIEKLHIKENTYKIALEHGIPHPKTFFHSNLDELLSMDLTFPLVIKPSIRDNFYSKVKIKGFQVRDLTELKTTYRYVNTIIHSSEILVQEMIPSTRPLNLYSAIVLFIENRVVTGLTVRRMRQHPMDFGHATTFAMVTEVPGMLKQAENFLQKVGYYGIAEVEFMYDEVQDVYKLLEVNPRICGWHSLSIASGIDLPYYLFCDMTNQEIPLPEKITPLKWVKLVTDLPTVFIEIIKGRMTLVEYIFSMKGPKEYAVFSWNDPLPFIVELMLIPYLWIKRGF